VAPKLTLRIPGEVVAGTLYLLLIVGISLVIMSFLAKAASDRLLHQHPRYARSLGIIDRLRGAIPKLEEARKALTDYSEEDVADPDTGRTVFHPANPRESARHLERARNELRKCRDPSPAVTEIGAELAVLIAKLRQVDIVRGENFYSPLNTRIMKLRQACDSERSSLVGTLPEGLFEERAELKKQRNVTGIAGSAALGLCLLLWWKLRKQTKRVRGLQQNHGQAEV
jgi:hypothetical protein